ncbi:L-threonylcarbamoyladenylate synthase [Nitrococcus mobilis]|uniref:Putative translation factor SUA5 n=1 Tax=Nitrococcus mobilis Nb-231 TaxID=314278 RepID=A4BM33_9GAMM|nr:L-threonylcarbamoyladenylate synthase [Nitrococcus mobilis]EAR23371.1 putative translation factor SUA5 [Nitrococcus mobilis Nb-231]
MCQFFVIHPMTPQPRLIRRTAEILQRGGVIAYPTDTAYALGCCMGEREAVERIRRLRKLHERHNFTLACRDLSDIGTYAKVGNNAFRLLKAHTPGPYTFVLPATGEVPRRLQHPKRKTIGIRVPDSAVANAICAELGAPLMTTTLLLPHEDLPLTDPELIRERIGAQLDLIIDGGAGGLELSTVIDLTGETPAVIRRGVGNAAVFEA